MVLVKWLRAGSWVLGLHKGFRRGAWRRGHRRGSRHVCGRNKPVRADDAGRRRWRGTGSVESPVAPLAGSGAHPGGGSGAAGDRGNSGVKGQMGGGSEMLAVDFGLDSCAGPDADAGHRCQDLIKRVGLHEGLDLGCDLVPLPAQCQELLGQFRQHDSGRSGAHDHHRLLVQSSEHGLCQAFSGPRWIMDVSGGKNPCRIRPANTPISCIKNGLRKR